VVGASVEMDPTQARNAWMRIVQSLADASETCKRCEARTTRAIVKIMVSRIDRIEEEVAREFKQAPSG
jgi:hypothetical protein